jgi:hypothetical protein
VHLLYVVPWADCFVYENKSISFYQHSPRGLSVDSVLGMRGTELGEANILWRSLATGAPTPYA